MIAFRKIYVNDVNYFAWPTAPDTIVTYDSNNHYDDNFFFIDGFMLTTINGDYTLSGDTWAVVSYDAEDVIDTTNYGPTFLAVSKLTILYTCAAPDATFKGYFDLTGLNSEGAYQWGYNIGDKDVVSDYVTDQSVMGRWVKYVNPTDYNKFVVQITERIPVYYWATELDEQSFVPQLDSELSFNYAVYFPDRIAVVRSQITDPYWIGMWNQYIEPNNPIIP